MSLRTPLFSEHQRLGARLVPFGGWEMPLHYGSQIEEHHAVRRAAGVFDVSHMRTLDIEGPEARALLRRLLANDVARLEADVSKGAGADGDRPAPDSDSAAEGSHQGDDRPARALYSCMLNEAGGTVDDLIVYRRGPDRYRLVVNAANAEGDLAWIRARSEGLALRIQDRRELAMLAVQGPEARARCLPLLPAALREAAGALKPFQAVEAGDRFVARTGYTGEDGFEIVLPADAAVELWRALLDAGVRPCGLGARDTLRLEAGLNLHGQDMDASVGPLECGLDWTVAWDPPDRDFIGRAALTALRADPRRRRFVGLLLTGRGVLRAHQPVLIAGRPAGEILSGGFAPTLERSIALARLAPGFDLAPGDPCAVEIRGVQVPARAVRPPFARHGQIRVPL